MGRRKDPEKNNRAEALETSTETTVASAGGLQAVAFLAAGLAHELSNTLGQILSIADLARLTGNPDDPQTRDFRRIVDACLHGRDVIEDTMKLLDRREAPLEPLSLECVERQIDQLIRSSIPSDRSLTLQVVGAPPDFTASRTHITQILVNLVSNAAQATASGGSIDITINEALFDSPLALSPEGTLKPGTYLSLCVTDNGRGIPPTAIKRIFEPFVTTREGQGGTGLGLAVVQHLAGLYRGGVEVTSKPGTGTAVTVYLASG
ncbi:MAG: ATP-binding protein [Pseudomonadota bacterium]